MVLKSDQARVKALLKETITLLCKNGLSYQSEFCIEALIGITLDHDEVFLVSIKETIAADKACRTTHDSDSDQQEPDICITAVQTHTNNTSRKRPMRTPPRQEMEAATRQTWSPSGGHSIRSVTESNIANATPIHTYSSTSFLKSHSRKRTQVCDGNVGSPSLTNQSDSSLSSDNDRVSRDCNLSNRLQGEGHWEGHSTEEPPPKKAVKDRNPPTTDSFNDKYTQEIDSKSNILNSDILVIKEESSKEDCSESYSLSSGTLQPAGMPNVLASLAASLTQGPLGTYTGPSAATSWEQLPHVSRGSYLTSTGHSASQDSIPSMPMHLGVTQPDGTVELVHGTGIYIPFTTFTQLMHLETPTKVIRRLVRVLFPDQRVLANSCCMGRPGSRPALDHHRVEAIKEFVTQGFPKTCSSSTVHDVINHTCVEARRDLKRQGCWPSDPPKLRATSADQSSPQASREQTVASPYNRSQTDSNTPPLPPPGPPPK